MTLLTMSLKLFFSVDEIFIDGFAVDEITVKEFAGDGFTYDEFKPIIFISVNVFVCLRFCVDELVQMNTM